MSEKHPPSSQPHWQTSFEAELHTAQQARSAGKEGKARVCSRRAAGIVIGEYFRRQNIQFADPSSVARLKYLQTLPGISPAVQRAAELLLLRVKPDYTLPVDGDLLTEARRLADELLD